MIGTADELAAQGIAVAAPDRTRTRRRAPVPMRVLDDRVALRDDVNPMFLRAIAAALPLLVGSTMLLRFAYQRTPGMTWIDALYFSTETIATVGYGDFSFVNQPTWLRLFGIMLMFAGVLVTAVLVAFVADLLLSRRIAYSAGRRRARELRNHVIVVGLGSFGIRVVSRPHGRRPRRRGDRTQPDNRFLSSADDLDVPVIFGDATLRQTLESARVDDALAVAVLTQDDMVNIETGIVLREMLGPRWMRSRPATRRAGGAARLRPGPGRRRRASVRVRKRPVDSRVGRALVHRRRDGPAGGRHVLGGPALVHGRRRAGANRAASSTGCGWSSCPPRPASSRSPGRARRPRCTRAAIPGLRRRHRLSRRPVPGAAGHAAQGPARPAGGRR